jgi:hypothetical protein
MDDTNMVKVTVIDNDIEANLLEATLTDEAIPHLMQCYFDPAYDGIFQRQKGWGCVRAQECDKARVLAILDDIRHRECTPEENEDVDA